MKNGLLVLKTNNPFVFIFGDDQYVRLSRTLTLAALRAGKELAITARTVMITNQSNAPSNEKR